MAGFLDNFANSILPSNKGVTYNAVPLDSGTQGLINSDAALASAPASDFTDKLNANVQGRAGQVMQSQRQGDAEDVGMGGQAGQSAAIRNMYNAEAEKGIKRIQDQNDLQGQLNKYQMTNQTAMAAMAQQKVQVQNYEGLTQAYNQSVIARAQVLSDILGAGGTMAGVGMAKRSGRKAQASNMDNAIGSFNSEGLSQNDGYNTNYV